MTNRFAYAVFASLAAVFVFSAAHPSVQGKPSRYLYVWAGMASGDAMGPDVIAVIDADPSSPTYAKVVDALMVDSMGMMPHHTEFDTPKSGAIFVNDYMGDKSFLIDPKNPAHPSLAGRVAAIPAGHTQHSFARLSNGHVLATVQFGNGKIAGNPGGLAEFDANGKLVQYGSAADPTYPDQHLRTYALTTLPAIDRVVTTSSAMDTETVANVVQVWRMSDLKLIKTLEVAKTSDATYKHPFEVRTLADGHTVLMNTYHCGFYRLTGHDKDPKIEHVMSMEAPKNFGCSVPIIVGKFMVMPIAYAHRYATIDISDPAHPREVASVEMDTTFYPHWISRDPLSDRVVVTDQGDGPPFVMLGHFDAATGKLTWDERFRDAGASHPGVSFLNVSWPNGIKGKVTPHGALFVP